VLIKDHGLALEQPDGFLPFAIGEEQAAEALREAQQTSLRRVKTWFTGKGPEQTVPNLQGVYVPFWVFDGFVDVHVWSERMSASNPMSDLAERLGDGKMMFDNLMFVAVNMPAFSRLERIFPYTLGQMTPYTPQFLANWPALLYNRDVDTVAMKADRALLAMARERAGLLAAPTSRSSRPVMVRRSFQTNGLTYQLVLLPMWVALLQVDDEIHLALVNGQTGKAASGPQVISQSDD
jgi:hypothetical protein